MKHTYLQSGASLIVSLIMLVVLTLLVISGMRSSNTNLRIAGNMQANTEGVAAAIQAVEQTINVDTSATTNDYTLVTADQTLTIIEGAATYAVVIKKPECEVNMPVMSSDESLYTTNGGGQKVVKDDGSSICIEASNTNDPIYDVNGDRIPDRTTCNLQNWKISATATDPVSGGKAAVHQGVTERKYTAASDCPAT